MIGGVTQPPVGNLGALTTDARSNVVIALNEVDANADAAAAAAAATGNLMWDSLQTHANDFSPWGGRNWWELSPGLQMVDDAAHPYGGKTLRHTVTNKGKGVYLKDVGLAPGDVISAGMLCKASAGTWTCRLQFRTTGPDAAIISTPPGAARTFAGETATLLVENVTIPATAGWVTVSPYSAAPTSLDVYAVWLHRGTVAATKPSPSVFTATYLQQRNWENYNSTLVIRNVDATTFHIYQPLPDGQAWIRWIFTKLATTNNWTYYGADMCLDNAGTGAYNVVIFDIGYALNLQPNGATAQTVGNHHLSDLFSVVNFYDSAGNTVDPTAAGAVLFLTKLRIEQKGVLRHPDTGAINHANISRFTEFTTEGPYEHMRLSWLTSNNWVAYWNVGQILAAAADRAWVHGHGDSPFVTGLDTLTVTGKTRAYSWFTGRKFAFEVECPSAEAIQLRTGTLKIYPRPIDTDAVRNAGDVDHGEWFWRVHYDRAFANRI